MPHNGDQSEAPQNLPNLSLQMENPQRQPRVMNWNCLILWADIHMTSLRIPGDLYILKPSNINDS